MAIDMEPFYSAVLLHPGEVEDSAAQYSVIREITREEHERYQSAYHDIERVLHTGIWTYIRHAATGVTDAMHKDVEEMLSGNVSLTQPDDVVRLGIRMRGAVLTFCSAIHIHQEHTFAEVMEKFGENSTPHVKIRKIFTRLYDKSLAYRILWHTRNTMVHHSMETIAVSATAFLDENREPQAVSTPRVDLSAITDLNPRISDAFRNEILAIDENPLVLELIHDAFPLMLDANRRILRHLYPRLDDACQIVREFDALFGDRDGVRCITRERSTNDPPPLKFSHSVWSGDVVMFARLRAGMNQRGR